MRGGCVAPVMGIEDSIDGGGNAHLSLAPSCKVSAERQKKEEGGL